MYIVWTKASHGLLFLLKKLKMSRDSTDIELMAKKLKILLVEDDKRFGESLQRLLEKEGFDCIYADKPQAALSFCKLHPFDIAIVDCMLPQMNGVELALKIKEFFGPSLVLFMMSGIYKDRNFTISALKKTGAKSFLIKPFDVADLVSQLKEMNKNVSAEPVLSDNALKNLLLQENLTQNLVYTALEKMNIVNGQELPVIFNFLLSFRGAGVLNIKSETSEISVHFAENSISIPMLKCTGPKLKNILISKECIAQEDLQILKMEDTTIERAVELNYLSPHFGNTIYKEYSLQQLHTFARNIQLNISFKAGKIEPQSIVLAQKEIDDIIYNWVLTSESIWLKTYYLPYTQHSLKKMNTSQNKTQLFPLVSGNKNILSFMMQNKSLEEVLSQSSASNDDTPIRLMHLLMIYREFYIGTKSNNINYGIQIERLKKLLVAMEHQNAFERMGLKESSSDQEIKRTYTEMSQTLHPDKLKDAPQELVIVSTKVYDKIQDAYNSIKTPEKRQDYLKRMDVQKADKLGQANRLIDDATNNLMRGDLSAADAQIQSALLLAPTLPRSKLIHTWHQLKIKKISAADALKNILSVPNDDKESALYMHVRGLCHLALNEFDKALNSFKNALVKDPNFVASRRELSVLSQDDKKANVSLLNADLRDVVGMFFNKKPKKK